MNKQIIKIALFTIIFLLFISSSTKASAQGVDIGIYPPIIEVNLTPPATIKIPFTVFNYKEESVDLKISIKPFTASEEENGQLIFTNNSELPDPDIKDKIIIYDKETPIDSLTLFPKQQRDLVLELKIPAKQAKGDYYLSMLFLSAAQTINDSNSSGATAGVTSNILLSVGPQGKTKGILEDFSVPFFISKGPVPFNVRLRNTSDHFIAPKGDIIIKNMFGQAIGKVNLLPVNILSNSLRRLPDSLQGAVSEKDYSQIKKTVEKNKYPVAVWPEKFLLGLYKATLTISLSDQGPVFRRDTYFFAFPSEYLMTVLIVIGIVAFIILRVKKKIG
jgi:hypothetical protein